MGKMIDAAEFRKNAARILDELEATGEPVTITRTGAAGGDTAATTKPLSPLFGLLKSDRYSFPDPFSPIEDLWEEAFIRKWDDKLL